MITETDILNASLLIVDDQAANVQLLVSLLTEAGYTAVSSTMNPREVRQLDAKNHYDLILLDLKMPGMDGFQVMDELKQDNVDAYLSVIVLTAEPGHKLRALQAGAKDFISKPFDLVEVKTRIHNMLEIRLCHKRIEQHNDLLEQTVNARTAQLVESEARFRSLTALASDWYWEQNETGVFTTVSGPVFEMIGLGMTAFLGKANAGAITGWNEIERKALQTMITARRPFLDFAFSRTNADGVQQNYRVSGEPMVDTASRFVGYRGIGVEVHSKN